VERAVQYVRGNFFAGEHFTGKATENPPPPTAAVKHATPRAGRYACTDTRVRLTRPPLVIGDLSPPKARRATAEFTWRGQCVLRALSSASQRPLARRACRGQIGAQSRARPRVWRRGGTLQDARVR
jgi:hypothetical protein